MIAAHALDALEAAEARDVESHLATCAECRAELDAWQSVSASLVYATPLAEPSAELRSRILQSVRAETRKPSSRAALKDNGEVKGVAVKSSPTESNVVPFEKPARRSWSAPSRVWALAASLAFIAFAISLILLWQRNNALQAELETESARLSERKGQLEAELARLANSNQGRPPVGIPPQQTGDPLANDESFVALAGTSQAPGARAMILYDKGTGRAMLSAQNLPAPPAGKAYQLWFIVKGKPVSGGVFMPNAAGRAKMRAQIPEVARESPVIAVTLEPAGGVSAPTGEKYLLGATS